MNYSEISNKYRFGIIFATGIILVAFGLICSSYVFDMEPPSGEAMILEKAYENEQNKEALDRVRNGSDDPRDREKAENFVNDNMAWR